MTRRTPDATNDPSTADTVPEIRAVQPVPARRSRMEAAVIADIMSRIERAVGDVRVSGR